MELVAMLSKKPLIQVVVAIVLVVFLAVFGINRIGGETWISAAAGSEPGLYANTGPYHPPSESLLRGFIVPVAMILVIIALATLGVILQRYSSREIPEEAPSCLRGHK